MNRLQIPRLFGLLVSALWLALPAHAQRAATEMPGAADHPLLSRYAGSVLQAVSQPAFEQLLVPNGPSAQAQAGGREFPSALRPEGNLSAHFYVAAKDRTGLEVFRSYERALGSAGFKILFRCELKACYDEGIESISIKRETLERVKWPKNVLTDAMEREFRFLTAHLKQGGREAFVLLFVADRNSIWEGPRTMQLVLEPKAMDDGQVLVNAGKLRQGLGTEGRIALYGLSFDTGKSVIKPESRAQLVEMASVLAADPRLKVAIVGHTDIEGTVEANLKLSQARAEAVVQSLVREHGVNAARLDAKGVAAYAPVASNASPEGRAKNRRVEMVQR